MHTSSITVSRSSRNTVMHDVTGHGVHGAQRSGPLGAFQPSTGPETHFQSTVLGTRHVINVGPCAEIVHTSGIHTRKEIMVALHYPRESTCWSRNPIVRLKTKLTRPCSRVDLDCNKPHKVHADYSCSTRLWFLDDFTQEQSHGGANFARFLVVPVRSNHKTDVHAASTEV